MIRRINGQLAIVPGYDDLGHLLDIREALIDLLSDATVGIEPSIETLHYLGSMIQMLKEESE